jgi:ribonuclease D
MRRRRGTAGARAGLDNGLERTEVEYVDTPEGLAEACSRAGDSGRYALDTEFHRERTYFPKLALLQLHWTEGDRGVNVLIDPLAIGRDALADSVRGLLETPATALMHAAQQDLEILELLTGIRPSRLFDCQLAAGFLGYATPSLGTLAQSTIGVSLAKGERLTDWLARPLTDAQHVYAINDVVHLPAIESAIRRQLETRARLPWALEACEAMRTRPLPGGDPQNAWMRIKEVRALKGESFGAAQELAAWRDLRARKLDIPVRRVLSDMALVSIAQRLPRDARDLERVRGVNPGQLHADTHDALIDAVERGRMRTQEPRRNERGNGRYTRTSATVLNAWVAEVSRREQIDPVLVATRDDVEAFLEHGLAALPDGWRRELVGNDFQRLVDGSAGLVLDANGHLDIVEIPGRNLRSHR